MSFVNYPIDKLLNRENIFSRVESLEGRVNARPSARVGQLGQLGERTGNLIVDGSLAIANRATGDTIIELDATGQHMDAGVYPSSARLDWIAVDSGVTIGELVGSYAGALTNSGLLVYGQAHDSGVRGLVYLAAKDHTGTVRSSFLVDTQGVISVDVRDGTNTALNSQGFLVQTRVSSTTDINNAMYLDTETTGNPIAGFGTAISFRAENTAHAMIDLGYVGYRWTTATAGAESSKAVFGVKDGGTAVDGLEVSKTGINAPIGLSVASSGFFNLASSDLTIASGVVTATGSHHRIDTQSAAATDDLDTINGGVSGDILIIHAVSGVRDVVAKDGTGNLALNGDFTMDTAQDMLMLMKIGTTWFEVSRSSNS